ncbi:MAG: hypothetical protein A3J69_01700 [Candidatus Levybacteria bacterium RIFCSPHIGHO2_02_FULL_42_12]|nr:MAG: hypothetical protein A2698_02050 [Candidatus Levybacteria bacterium RIFCSPHIGHO2_01_FULL_42_15]OGH30774.1 MAG: hypothetical protein A3J69_01700 [Candidatus Levybacteria bacterium RIFCSPHIGHO2_02_FULL_42_12]
MNIVFFGSSPYVLPILEVLKSDFGVSLVVTTASDAATAEKNLTDPVIAYAISQRIPHFSIKNFSSPDTINNILNTKSQVGVLAFFGLLIPPALLNGFSKGIVNIHPSLLPRLRGSTPVQTAVLNGEIITGVSLIRLDESLDHGPLIAQKEEAIEPSDTTHTLHKRLFKAGAELLKERLLAYLAGSLTLTPQDETRATYTKPLSRDDGYIDISYIPPKEVLDRMIRAYFPWPSVWTTIKLNKKQVRIKLLPEQKIQVEGGIPMSQKDFLNGYPEAETLIQKLNN